MCQFCGAIVWSQEQTILQKQKKSGGFSICCGEGKIELPLLREPPLELQHLLNNTDAQSKAFRQHIRLYNTLFSFTSMGGNIDTQVNEGTGPYVFRLNGQVYHLMGSLLPANGEKPLFAQLYMFDGQDDVHGRINSSRGKYSADENTVTVLKNMFDRENELVKIFRQARNRFAAKDYIPVSLRLVANRATDGRHTNMPSNAYEFAALVPSDDFNNPRDIVVQYCSSELNRISTLHPSFMSLQYPILFPFGEDGYRTNILRRGITCVSPNKRNTVTMREYYAFRLQYRENEGHTLLKGGRLFLQFVVDAWACVEHGRLSWVMNNQATLRAELYNNIIDSVSKGDTCATSVGKRVVLPPSFTGSPRYMQQNYQDCLAVCRKLGHPDLFITFTCNPKWPEIAYFLEHTPMLDASVRPDIISRVFKMKVDILIDDLLKNHIFGHVIAGTFCILIYIIVVAYIDYFCTIKIFY